MPITEQDWKAHVDGKVKDLDTTRAVNVNYLRQAALHSQHVTNHPAWDHYLQKLQAWLEDTEREIRTVQENLATPLSEDQVRLAYVALNVLTERKRVLTSCITLPKDILAHAAEHGLVTG